jgi:hypothetical protein
VSCSEAAGGRFVAAGGDFRGAALEAARDTVSRGFFDIVEVPDRAPISGLTGGRKPLK